MTDIIQTLNWLMVLQIGLIDLGAETVILIPNANALLLGLYSRNMQVSENLNPISAVHSHQITLLLTLHG